MNYINLFKIAIRAIGNNKTRSFLTMLGIIIGVGAVIFMMAIGQGTKDTIKSNISEMGSNIIMVMPGADMRGGVRQDPSAMQTLKMTDLESIESSCKYITACSPVVNSSGQVIAGANNATTTLYGVNDAYLSIKQLKVKDGTMFDERHIKQNAKVCVIGKTVADNLFPNGKDPVGHTIRFKSIPFRIIGVLESKGYNSMGMDQDDLILAPYSTVMKRILAQTFISSINCSAVSEEMTDNAIDEMTALLRHNHKLRDGEDDDFNIRSQQEIMEMMTSTTNTITIFLVLAGGISLLVGGIGIMNIMLVSVTERTREIGLRMSVGARGVDILTQFLIESILISVTGGVLGILLGFSLSWGADRLFNLPCTIQGTSIIVSFVICTCIGIIFGWLPAQKAARLNPIEAIRYE